MILDKDFPKRVMLSAAIENPLITSIERLEKITEHTIKITEALEIFAIEVDKSVHFLMSMEEIRLAKKQRRKKIFKWIFLGFTTAELIVFIILIFAIKP